MPDLIERLEKLLAERTPGEVRVFNQPVLAANFELVVEAVNSLPLLLRAASVLKKLAALHSAHGPTCRGTTVGAMRKEPGWTCDCGKAEADQVLKELGAPTERLKAEGAEE